VPVATRVGRTGAPWRARRALLVVLLLSLLPTVPASPADGADDRELDSARRELETATRELSDIEAAVARAGDEVAVLDERLRLASTELRALDVALVGAIAAAEAAVAAERAAAARLAEVDAELSASLADWHQHRDQLASHAVHAYKHGPGSLQDLFVRGVAGAEDWHDVGITLRLLDRLSEDEHALVGDALVLTRATAELRATAGTARSEAVTTARAAADEQRRVASLQARQAATVASIDDQLRTRAQVLADLESDAAARAVLVADLEARVARLELAAITVLVPVQVDLDVFGPAPAWAAGLPGGGRGYAAAVEAIAARNGIDGRLFAALVWSESNFRPDAVSHAGALGLAQLMPGTARGLGVDPRDPLQNLDGGARYLRAQLDRFGRVDLALAAYNAGPGRVQQAGGVPNIVETQLYVVKVLERYEALGGLR
jgi:soluble lytic murein transglycosylase-like protein